MKKIAVLGLLCLLSMSTVMALTKDMVTFTEDKLAMSITPDQSEFILKLKSNPTTGYSWFIKAYDKTIFTAKKHYFQAEKNQHLVGAPGVEYFVFTTKKDAFIFPQETTVKFIYKRPWETNADAKELSYTISLSGK